MKDLEADLKNRAVKIRTISGLRPYKRNARTHGPAQIEQIKASLERFGFTNPILIDKTGEVIAGHGRLLAAEALGIKRVPTIELSDLTPDEVKAYRLADNAIAERSGWDIELLASEFGSLDGAFEGELLGFDQDMLDSFARQGAGYGDDVRASGKLVEAFGVAPFSVFDARSGNWQNRRRAWLDLGIDSGKGRPDQLINYSKQVALKEGGTSIFDPVLAEIAYAWYSRPSDRVVDPFAGGSVRGICAALMGRAYVGVDLRKEQIKANRKQWTDVQKGTKWTQPKWILADAQEALASSAPLRKKPADLIFSCPPYVDLEAYSGQPADLSNMPWTDFIRAYRKIISLCYDALAEDRFAVWVVGEVRRKNGCYYNFVGETITAFLDAGFQYHAESVLVISCGSAALRASRQMRGSRRPVKTHQNVLVFVKGDGKKAAKRLGDVELFFGDLEAPEGEPTEFGERISENG